MSPTDTVDPAVQTNGSSSNLLMDKLEEAFQNCVSVLVKEDGYCGAEREVLRVHAETAVSGLMDCARQLEQSFLQKRLLISVHRPDWLLKEEIQEMKLTLARREELVRKNHEKIGVWKSMLADLSSHPRPNDTHDTQLHTRTMTPTGGAVPPAMMYRGPMGGGPMARGAPGPAPVPMSNAQSASLAGHLACLEKTTSNIGVQDPVTGPR